MKRLILILVVGAFFYYYFTNNGQKTDILGTFTKRESPIKIDFPKNSPFAHIMEAADKIGSDAAQIGGKFISKAAANSASNAGSLVLKTTVENVLKQFTKLPKDQQALIRKQICKP